MAEYRFPTADLLKDSTESSKFQRLEYVQQLRDRLNGMFASFGTDVKVVDYHYNNFAILMKLQLGRGVKAQTVKNLRADIELHAGDPVEFMDSADGKTITIAVKNFQRPVVPLREVIASAAFREAKSPVSVAAGINLFGNAFVFDIATMPNLLVAGVTGSGKSIFLHDIILSILFKARPEEVKLLLFDMKKVEFPLMNGIPHMLQDTITDTDHGMDVMMWLRDEVDHRLFRMAMANAPSIDEYNAALPEGEKLPRIVLIIDEYMEYIRQKTEEAYEAERVDMFNATLESILEKYTHAGHVQLIHCGGDDMIAAAREQWNDGSNTLAIAPGKVVVYERNDVTNPILRDNGIEILEMPSAELSRGRGGPRCMSMPLIRAE